MQCRMLLVGPSLIAGSVLTLPPVVNADAQPQTITINTSQMRTGLAPRDFAFTLTGDGPVSAWKVVADPTATAEKAIAQRSAPANTERIPARSSLIRSASPAIQAPFARSKDRQCKGRRSSREDRRVQG